VRYDPQKSFGYPVLREGSKDYLQGSFQPSIGLDASKTNKQNYVIDYTFHISVPELEDLITEGSAQYVLIASCTPTFFQKVAWLDTPEGEFEIDGGLLRGEVDLAPYLIATRKITDFVCDKVNPEFGQDSFDFPEGAVLACYHQDPYYVDREVFSNITSIFDYVESEEIKKGEWNIDLEGERIKILMHPKQLGILRRAANDNSSEAVIMSAIFFPALIEILRQLVADDGLHEDKRWANIVKARCANAPQIGILSETTDLIRAAQILFRLPLTALNKQVFDGENFE